MAGVEGKVLVLDEPSANLDHKTASTIIDQLTSMEEVTVVMVTHEYDPAILAKFDQIVDLSKTI